MSSDARARRASWPILRHRLGEEPTEGMMAEATMSERVAMVWAITVDTWASMGTPIPSYARGEMPGRMIRRGR